MDKTKDKNDVFTSQLIGIDGSIEETEPESVVTVFSHLTLMSLAHSPAQQTDDWYRTTSYSGRNFAMGGEREILAKRTTLK